MSSNPAVEQLKRIIASVESEAFVDFLMALLDAHYLRAIYDKEMQQGKHNLQNMEVVKRAGIILAITAWEIFVEGILAEEFKKLMQEAIEPEDMQSAFNTVAEEWLNSKPKPPELAKWTSIGWQDFVSDKFHKDIESLNTPNSANIRKLSKRYLSLDLTQSWKWRGVSSDKACQRLDDLIGLRGRLVHRGRYAAENGSSVTRRQLMNALDLVYSLAHCTYIALHASTGKAIK